MPITPFSSNGDLIRFAENFLFRMKRMLNRDIKICLTADSDGKHAYFPALMACFSFLEMLAGLHKGDTYPKEAGVLDFVSKFMDTSIYSNSTFKMIYQGMRHKIAHQAHPCFVTEHNRTRYVWVIAAGSYRPPIKIKKIKASKLKMFSPPWDVRYDHRLSISIPSFKKDVIKSADDYFQFLKGDAQAQKAFAKSIKSYFPP